MKTKNLYIGSTELVQHIKKYLDLLENGYTIYIIRHSKIVGQLAPAQYQEDPYART